MNSFMFLLPWEEYLSTPHNILWERLDTNRIVVAHIQYDDGDNTYSFYIYFNNIHKNYFARHFINIDEAKNKCDLQLSKLGYQFITQAIANLL